MKRSAPRRPYPWRSLGHLAGTLVFALGLGTGFLLCSFGSAVLLLCLGVATISTLPTGDNISTAIGVSIPVTLLAAITTALGGQFFTALRAVQEARVRHRETMQAIRQGWQGGRGANAWTLLRSVNVERQILLRLPCDQGGVEHERLVRPSDGPASPVDESA